MFIFYYWEKRMKSYCLLPIPITDLDRGKFPPTPVSLHYNIAVLSRGVSALANSRRPPSPTNICGASWGQLRQPFIWAL